MKRKQKICERTSKYLLQTKVYFEISNTIIQKKIVLFVYLKCHKAVKYNKVQMRLLLVMIDLFNFIPCQNVFVIRYGGHCMYIASLQ